MDFSGKKKAEAELKKKKKDLLGQKLGKKWVYWPKIDQFSKKKKRDFLGKKKQAGAELKKKKRNFWAKNWEKIEYKDQIWPIFSKKKILWAKNCGKNGV